MAGPSVWRLGSELVTKKPFKKRFRRASSKHSCAVYTCQRFVPLTPTSSSFLLAVVVRKGTQICCLCPAPKLLVRMGTQICCLCPPPQRRSLTFLVVQVQCDGPNIRWGLKNKVLVGYLTDNPAILRFHDPHTSTARDRVRMAAHLH